MARLYSKLIPAALLLSAGLLAWSCDDDNDDPKVIVHTSYTNPVTTQSLPDPTVIRADDGRFYLYATEDIANMPIMVSDNLIDWTQVGTAFYTGSRPSWPGVSFGLWAPDVNKINGKYYLYYSVGAPAGGTEYDYGIGVATSDDPIGPFKDQGKILQGGDVNVRTSIDPCYYEENGTKYIIWGSYYGIWIAELTDDGLALKSRLSKTKIAGVDGYGLEGAMLYKKDQYYYLFLSEGGSGYNNDYKLGVVRSTSLFGPYLNKAGNDVAKAGAPLDTFFIKSDDNFKSPGHCSQVIVDDNGAEWILYHSYVNGDSEGGRRLMLDKLQWDSAGWPYVGDGSGSPTLTSNEVPYFRN